MEAFGKKRHFVVQHVLYFLSRELQDNKTVFNNQQRCIDFGNKRHICFKNMGNGQRRQWGSVNSRKGLTGWVFLHIAPQNTLVIILQTSNQE